MKKIIFTLLLFIPICIFAQERKTYKGAYVYAGKSGEIEYEYIETAKGRVFDGCFSFEQSGHPSEALKMRGFFKNNLKNGLWTYAWGSRTSKRNFNNGKLEGLYESDGYYAYRDIKTKFKDNHLVGSFEYESYDRKDNDYYGLGGYTAANMKYTGQFDENGYATGEWILKYNDRDNISYIVKKVFREGYLVSHTLYNESTGVSKNLLIIGEYTNGQPIYIWDNEATYWYHIDRSLYHPFQDEFNGEKGTGYNNGNGKNSFLKDGFNFGEYRPKLPIRGFWSQKIAAEEKKRKKEQEEKAQQERAERAAKEKKEKEAAAREKKIQDEISRYDRTLYGSLLSMIRTNMNNGKNLEELKLDLIKSQFKATPKASSNPNHPNIKIIQVPIKYGIYETINEWVETKSIFIFDNTNKGWLDIIIEGNVKCNYGSSVNLESPCVFFDSQHFVLGVNEKKELYIAQKKDGKLKKKEIIKEISGNETELKKGFFYMVKDNTNRAIDPMKRITIEELNKTTRSRVLEKM